MTNRLWAEDVEDYIDKHGMVSLLTMIENVCRYKATHCDNDWQGRSLADAWQRGAIRIAKTARFKDWPQPNAAMTPCTSPAETP